MFVRCAGRSDFAQAHGLYKELRDAASVYGSASARDHFKRLVTRSGSFLVVAESEQQLIAMVTLHILPNMTFEGGPYALIENVVTSKELRGLGHGSAVMSFAAELAWSKGSKSIMLLAKLSESAAQGFYEKQGYTARAHHAMTLRHKSVQLPI
jgi:ribosomal protein S18 acetylase RimI-like enzyme